jgi:hypothetical protein
MVKRKAMLMPAQCYIVAASVEERCRRSRLRGYCGVQSLLKEVKPL